MMIKLVDKMVENRNKTKLKNEYENAVLYVDNSECGNRHLSWPYK